MFGWSTHVYAQTTPLGPATFTNGQISIDYSLGFNGDVTGQGSQTNQPINGPTGSVQYGYTDTDTQTTTGAAAVVNFNNGNANINGGWPSLSATTSTWAHAPFEGGSNGAYASAVATMEVQYNFVLSGPTGSVPLFVGASGQTSANGGEDFFQVSGPGNVDIVSPSQGSWSINDLYNLQPGEIYTVEMLVASEAAAVSGDSCPGQCIAEGGSTIDPMFYIDPSFSLASEYSLTFSPGINAGSLSTTPATPVPAALPLFATGLGALGLLGWFRKRKPPASLLGTA
jgi:hypothetical protein